MHPDLPSPSLDDRTFLLYHRSACATLTATVNNFNAGKMMRQYLAAAFASEEEDVQAPSPPPETLLLSSQGCRLHGSS